MQARCSIAIRRPSKQRQQGAVVRRRTGDHEVIGALKSRLVSCNQERSKIYTVVPKIEVDYEQELTKAND
ncbi:unnamed protein product [Caenorhabditis auriculariae]|uniref:Uncharacterized protein n=1 Tax=Caenorhabditis auriculariae TaxID=2777116 RepID=A0A8S1HBT5_9PELO|nr:unnamed protein product [Caenorhabditis auriculariae]